MALIVNTNIASLTAQNNLSTNQTSLQTTLQRLSSGLRVNSAKDDAAGLAVAEAFTSQIRGNTQAVRNANDGISLGQTAESALASIAGNLQRVREIAVQAANGTISNTNRSQLQQEVDQLTQEVSRIVQTTTFNGTSLLSGASSLTFQVGADGNATNQVSISTTNLATAGSAGLFAYSASLSATGTVNVTTSGGASAALASLDSDISRVSSTRSTFGAVQNRFEAVIANLQSYVTNLSASRSRILDADFAAETANLTRSQILQQAGTAVLSQANALPQSALTLLR